ncbi:MAG: hypothetical protein ACTSUQ_02115, partial [Candidatus Freyarchaeota archaeon]
AGAVNKPRGEQDGARPSGAKAETSAPPHTQSRPTRNAPLGHADTGGPKQPKPIKNRRNKNYGTTSLFPKRFYTLTFQVGTP